MNHEGGDPDHQGVKQLTDTLQGAGYLADRGLATALFIGLKKSVIAFSRALV